MAGVRLFDSTIQRGKILIHAIGRVLGQRNYPNWTECAEITVIPSESAVIEVSVDATNVLWPLAMCARTAFDTMGFQGSEWLGTSVWEPASETRPLLGVALMQESEMSWWTLDWIQQQVAPGLLTARLSWHNDPVALCQRLERFVDVMAADSRGARAASFIMPHIRVLRAKGVREKVKRAGSLIDGHSYS